MLSSDSSKDRRWHLVAAFLAIGVGIAGAAYNPRSIFALVCFTLAAIGYSAVTPVLWTIPPTFLKGQASAGGIALINAIGYSGSLIGPVAIGWARDAYGSFQGSMYFLSFLASIGAGLTLIVVRRQTPGQNASSNEPQDLTAMTDTRVANVSKA